jgi:hypothetical protein
VENTLNMVTREQKEVLLSIVQNFVSALNDRLKQYKKKDITNPLGEWWFWWTHGFYKEIAREVGTT